MPNVPGGFVNSDISKVAAADNFSCAVSLGKLYCWGNNQSGQLGNGSFEMSSQPSLVKSLSGTDGSFKNDGHITLPSVLRLSLTSAGSMLLTREPVPSCP